MANTSSAKKRIRQSEKHRLANTSNRSSIRTAIKKLRSAIEKKSSAEVITELKIKLEKTLDTFSRKGLIHWKTAARTKSRLTKQANKASL